MRKEFTLASGSVLRFQSYSGVMHPPIEDVTAQGYDLQFGTNVISAFSTYDSPSDLLVYLL